VKEMTATKPDFTASPHMLAGATAPTQYQAKRFAFIAAHLHLYAAVVV
jgi:hypothetical protein